MTTPKDAIVIKPEEHGLYKAAVTFMVSKRSEDDAWKSIASFVSQWKGDADALDAEFEKIEEQIKTDFAVTAMPAKWRSAKAVARKALRNNILMIDPADGQPYGKTLIERSLKTPVPALTAGQQAVVHTNKLALLGVSSMVWDTDAQRIYVRDQLTSLTKLL